MKKFVFVYYGGMRPENVSKEDMQKTMDQWMAWFGTFKEKMVDGGNPFGPVAKAVTKKGIEAIGADNWPATGYTIINAKDIDEAAKIAEGCPVLKNSDQGAVRVYEAMPM